MRENRGRHALSPSKRYVTEGERSKAIGYTTNVEESSTLTKTKSSVTSNTGHCIIIICFCVVVVMLLLGVVVLLLLPVVVVVGVTGGGWSHGDEEED